MNARIFSAIALLVFVATVSAGRAASPEIVVRASKGQFEEVKERVVHAIENRGLVLNYTARIGDMLERTGKDIGRTRHLYSRAESLEFCSAALSRDTMEADPHNIAYCPYAIAVYALPGEPGKVYLSYRKLASSGSAQSAKTLRAVEKLLDDIIREAAR
ncbi:MAG: DUF302 domain-containing protein [Betaproteobacteria bacterium]|nr:DUF302 domain-containing protein [Betaproteobacteria bacterium]